MAVVLIADDDMDIRSIARDYLTAMGFDAHVAANGAEALEQMELLKPDVLVLDLSMPRIDGWDVARRIRQNPQLRHTRILAFTAHAFKSDEEKAREAGCDAYLSKPFVPEALLEQVQRLLKPPDPP